MPVSGPTYKIVDGSIGSSSGDVFGPVSSTDNAIALWSGTDGDSLKNSVALIDSSGNISGLGSVTCTTGLFGDGTAGAPSFSFSSDPDTGLYRSASNTVSFSAGAFVAGSFSDSLWTFNSSSAVGFQFYRNSGSASGISIGNTANIYWLGVDTAGNFEGRLTNNAGTQFMEASSSGNVTFQGASVGQSRSTDGQVYGYVYNSSNTSNARAEYYLEVAGATAGDAMYSSKITSGNAWGWGLDNSNSDAFSLSYASGSNPTLGTNEFLNVTTGGALTLGASGGTQTHTINGDQLNLSGRYFVFDSDNTGSQGVGISMNSALTNELYLSAGTGNTSSANIRMFGSAHATNANKILFGNGSTTNGSLGSAGEWTLGASGGTQTHTINGALTATLNAGIGGTNSSSRVLNVGASNPLSATDQTAVGATFTATSAATSTVAGVQMSVLTAASAFTAPLVSGARFGITAGAGSTITRAILFDGSSGFTATGTISNRATFADNTAFTGNWFINSTSTNPSLLNGRVGLSGDLDSSYHVAIGNTHNLTGTTQAGIFTNVAATAAATSAINGVFIQASSAASAHTVTRLSLFRGNITAGASSTITRAMYLDMSNGFTETGTITNSAYIADNLSYTGDWFINSTSTNPSQFGGSVTGASFIPSGSTIPTNGMYLRTTNRPSLSANSVKVLEWGESSGNGFLIGGATSTGTFGISGDSATGGINVSGGSGASDGGNFQAYGGSHASLANDFALRRGTTNVIYYDDSASQIEATRFIKISNQADPGAVTDGVKIGSVDLSAGNATLSLRTETAVVTEAVVSDRTLSVQINGTTYKICLKA